MKKLLLTAAFVSLSFPAFAQDINWKPYVGADFQHTTYNYNSSYDAGGGNVLNVDSLLDDGFVRQLVREHTSSLCFPR